MGIEAKFDMKGISEYIQRKQVLLDTLILRNLNYLGMKCVILARTMNTYIDRTGNLRNSIGYVVVKNGEVTTSNFEASSTQGTDGKEGLSEGVEYATELAAGFPNGYVLIVVAGMNYASYVEDIHHLDVIAPAENMAKADIDSVVQKIVKSLNKAK